MTKRALGGGGGVSVSFVLLANLSPKTNPIIRYCEHFRS